MAILIQPFDQGKQIPAVVRPIMMSAPGTVVDALEVMVQTLVED
jgi:hypothetical protein